MAEYFPTSFTTVQPGPGTIVLGDDGTGPVNVDTSQIASYSYVYSTVSSASATMFATVAAASAALLESPEFMGTPTAPTAPQGTDTNQLATTAFVQTAVETEAISASGTFALMHGSATETFQVAAASGGTYAPQTLQVQSNSFNYTTTVTTTASGASGTIYTATYYPPITEYADGMVLSFYVPTTNLGYAYFNAGAGTYNMNMNESVLLGYEMYTGSIAMVQWQAANYSWHLVHGNGAFIVGPANYGAQAPQWGQVFAGNDATYHAVTGARALGTTYTNTYGKPIAVSVAVAAGATGSWINFYVNGAAMGASCSAYAAGAYMSGIFIVPTGYTYEVFTQAGTGTGTLDEWYELY